MRLQAGIGCGEPTQLISVTCNYSVVNRNLRSKSKKKSLT